MLSMPNVSSTSNLVTRPVLVAETVRPTTPVRAIEPTTAISKERSRTENKAPDTSTAAASALYTPNNPNQRAATAKEFTAESVRIAEEARERGQPPAEKSEIQKAMETQVKNLLVNVWKASAKAVDFLLQRESETASLGAVATLEAEVVVAQKSALVSGAADTSAKDPSASYSAQGGSLLVGSRAAGQLLDVLA